jgi:pimeloyl-ACP methyl ester carboxylesterase
MTAQDLKIAHREVDIPLGALRLPGTLAVPEEALGVVLFAHGSGSSRLSPRNRYVAEELNAHGIGTLLFDMLTEHEAGERANVFDIGLLADRLSAATTWLSGEPECIGLPLGYFGASTGAAAARVAAAKGGTRVRAIVSRGGRPDLAGEYLPGVRAPALLIVGGDDEPVLGLNRLALERLGSEIKQLIVIPGATHLFEEGGTLEQVAARAAEFFAHHLPLHPAHLSGPASKFAKLRAILRQS